MKPRLYLLYGAFFLLLGQMAAQSLTLSESKILALNTNFTLPIVKFSLTDKAANDEQLGRVSLFNTLGAGISINIGRLIQIRDTNQGATENAILDSDFKNIFGLQFGFVFSADLNGDEPVNNFAPTLSILLLDFQIGWGYELGTVGEDQSRHFFTLTYGIPLQKLSKKTSLRLHDWGKEIKDDKNAPNKASPFF